MIDIESYVFTRVYEKLLEAKPGISVVGMHTESPATLPCVAVSQESNITYLPSQDESLQENHAIVVFHVSVFSDQMDTNKSEAKELAAIADTEMQNMKFTREFMGVIPNADRTIYRIEMRYRAVVQRGFVQDGNTIYQMYRN